MALTSLQQDETMPISIDVNPESKLTIFSVIGEPSFKEGLATYKEFYEDNPTQNVVWD